MAKSLRRVVDEGRCVTPNANDITEIRVANPAEVQKACSIIGHANLEDGGIISRTAMSKKDTRRTIASTILGSDSCWL
ncbi:hypothetical protein PENPOL_c009G06963 [Penicillium polonicum]|uniref:Uncharacterized protein n=1 Tax=Penicillium polonicum TaxID=60169 RepID=A0A1V6NFG4_PENPO|nr:hypothetical protein PENPOL_c009G06963 [Penicillium polonicum]